jgi:hypothetical protein
MLNVCTIVAANYLPYARVLADSFFAHHPDGAFVVLLIDDEERAVDPGDGRIDCRRLADLGLDLAEIRRLAGIYDVTELATAVKPLLLRKLVDEGCASVTYLDPDIRIYDSLDEASRLAIEHGIVLTPHTMQPYPRDDRQVDGFFVLSAGVYNLGFIAIAPSARRFLDWWWQVTRREALSDVSRNMFTDQRWVDFVPGFFDHAILKDPGCNVAYWNLHGRDLSHDGNRYVVDGVPLRFFHFSGFDIRKPSVLSSHQGDRPRILLSDRPVLARLCQDYATDLGRAGLGAGARPPYGWSRIACGLDMTTRMRRLYRTGVMAAERQGGPEPPDPFDRTRPEAFLRWLNEPSEDGPRQVSRYLYSIYQDRLDLQIQFPEITGSDAARFAEWIWRDSDLREKTPLELLPVAEAGRPHAPRPGPDVIAPAAAPGADGSGIGPLESMLPHLEAMATLQQSAEGTLAGFRRVAQGLLFRFLRPYAFQQHQLQMQLIAALRQATVALRRQQQVHESLDARVRELTRELVAAKSEIRRLEQDSVPGRNPPR